MKGLLNLAVTIVALGVLLALASRQQESPPIYRNGVFLTTESPDVPQDAKDLLDQLHTVHSAAALKAAIDSGASVVVYDCSASGLLGDDLLSTVLPYHYGLFGINVEAQDLRSPGGCGRDPATAPFFVFERFNSCGTGYGGARFDEGGLFRAFLERDLRDKDCSPGMQP